MSVTAEELWDPNQWDPPVPWSEASAEDHKLYLDHANSLRTWRDE